MKRVVIAALIALGILTGCGSAETYPTLPDIQAAWEEARTLASVEARWRIPCKVIWSDTVIINNAGHRLLGIHEWRWTVNARGKIELQERITLFVTEYEMKNDPELIHDILVHELLHAVWLRLSIEVPGFQQLNPNSEIYVRCLTLTPMADYCQQSPIEITEE